MLYNNKMSDDAKWQRKKYPVGLDNVLMGVARKNGMYGLVRQWQVYSVWSRIVGKKLAEKTEPMEIVDQTLMVRVNDPSWAHQLTFMKEEILEKLACHLPSNPPKDLRFQVGTVRPVPTQHTRRNRRSAKAVDPKLVLASIDEEALRDKPKLRELFVALIEASYRLRK